MRRRRLERDQRRPAGLGRLLGAVVGLALVVAGSVVLVVARENRGEGRVPDATAARAGLFGPVGPTNGRCTGVPVTASDDLNALVDDHPAGTTYCISAGRHRLSEPVEPKRGDALIGVPGAVLSGSKEVTGWRRSGRLWWATAFLPAAPGHHGECLESVPTCGWTEDVFLDGRRLSRVGTVDQLEPGSVFADYDANRLAVAEDPAGHLVEQAVAPGLVRSTADDVTVANLVLEQAANEAQVGAVEGRQLEPRSAGSWWRILHNEVRLNHGVGVGFGSDALVSSNSIHDQGQLGFGAWGSGAVVSNNEIADNGVAGYSSEWEAGGSKSWQTTGLRIENNDVHGNRGPGLWTDGGNIDTVYADNVVSDNWGAGIQHELSYDAVIRHNVVAGNGRRHKGWAWEAGIQIQSSGGTSVLEVTDNDVVDNANGIVLLDSGRRTHELPRPHGPHVVQNVWVHDNRVRMGPGQVTGAVEDTGDPSIFATNRNRFEGNVYLLDSLTEPHFAWDDRDLGWAQWRGLGNGNDLSGRAELRRP